MMSMVMKVMIALAQTPSLVHNPESQTNLRLQLAITNADISSDFVFNYSQQVEVEAHKY